MTEPLPKLLTVEDFLEWEAQPPERYEFIDGSAFRMVGGSAAHATIKDNVTRALRARLQGQPCRVYVESLKVVTPVASHYPDVVDTVLRFSRRRPDLENRSCRRESPSRTTADRDRGAKWVGYQDIASLQHYLLIAQDQRRWTCSRRADDRWAIRASFDHPDRVKLSAIGVELTLDESTRTAAPEVNSGALSPATAFAHLGAQLGPAGQRCRCRPPCRNEIVQELTEDSFISKGGTSMKRTAALLPWFAAAGIRLSGNTRIASDRCSGCGRSSGCGRASIRWMAAICSARSPAP